MNGPEEMLRTLEWEVWNGEVGGELREMLGGRLAGGWWMVRLPALSRDKPGPSWGRTGSI